MQVLEAGAPPAAGADFVLRGRVTRFELSSSYHWWAFYVPFILAPIPGSSIGCVIFLVAGSSMSRDNPV